MNPADLKYSEDHEWIRLGDDDLEVGITDYAQSELGDITFIELPEAGKDLEAHDEIGVIESVKAASDVYAPISGTVSAVNKTLEDMPETINRDPYGDGWICKFVDFDEAALGKLMSAEEYEKFVATK